MNVEVHFGCETKTIVFFNVFDVASEMNFSVYFGAGCRLFRGRLTSISGQAAVYFGAGCLPPLRAWRARRDCRKDRAIYVGRSRAQDSGEFTCSGSVQPIEFTEIGKPLFYTLYYEAPGITFVNLNSHKTASLFCLILSNGLARRARDPPAHAA